VLRGGATVPLCEEKIISVGERDASRRDPKGEGRIGLRNNGEYRRTGY